jgi:serine/threonine protein phosphatase 1
MRFLNHLWRRDARPPAALPAPLTVYAIGDIHGEIDALNALLADIGADAADRPPDTVTLIFLGDYVDRGADSRAVLDRLTGPDLPPFHHVFLRGNHEQAMLDFLDRPRTARDWLDHGGVETLASYGVRISVGTTDPARLDAMRDDLRARLPDRHLAFLDALSPWVAIGDYAFVHAGIRPGRPLHRQTLADLLWIRDPFLNSHRRHEKIVVHGHTIADAPDIRPNRIGIDTGAYATGILTALVLSGTERRILQTSRASATAGRNDGRRDTDIFPVAVDLNCKP